MIKKLILRLIVIYQRTLSPDTGWFYYKHPNGFCRYWPHCSEYGRLAIVKHGVIKGIFLLSKRVLKCNPFNRGGYDPLK